MNPWYCIQHWMYIHYAALYTEFINIIHWLCIHNAAFYTGFIYILLHYTLDYVYSMHSISTSIAYTVYSMYLAYSIHIYMFTSASSFWTSVLISAVWSWRGRRSRSLRRSLVQSLTYTHTHTHTHTHTENNAIFCEKYLSLGLHDTFLLA